MPIHFLWGDEDFLIERRVQQIKKEVLGDVVNDLNYKKIDNPSFSLFSETIRTNAMMFGDILCVIKCSKYFLETKTKIKLDEKQVKELIDGFSNVSEKVHLVLICETPRGEKKKPDSRKKLYKELIKIAKVEEFPSYRNYEEYKLIPIVNKMAKEIDVVINQKEISTLIQLIGSNLRDISNQLEKLKLFAYPKKELTQEMILNVVNSNSDIFSLVDIILKKDYTNAINLISEILQKEHFLPSLAFLETTFSNLVKLKLFSNEMSSFDLARKLNQNEYVVKLNLEKIKNIPANELIRLKVNLVNSEYLLKSGAIKDPILAYEKAFLECGEIK